MFFVLILCQRNYIYYYCLDHRFVWHLWVHGNNKKSRMGRTINNNADWIESQNGEQKINKKNQFGCSYFRSFTFIFMSMYWIWFFDLKTKFVFIIRVNVTYFSRFQQFFYSRQNWRRQFAQWQHDQQQFSNNKARGNNLVHLI